MNLCTCALIVGCTALIVSLPGQIAAQTTQAYLGMIADATPQLGVLPSGAYQTFSIDQINVQSGNAVIDIPLFSLPQLGDLSLSFSATGNTTTWQAGYECESYDVTCTFFYYTYSTPSSSPLYTLNIGPSLTVDQAYNVTNSTSYVGLYALETLDDTYTILQTLGTGAEVAYTAVDRTLAKHPLYYDSTNLSQLRSVDGSGLLFKPSTAQPYNVTVASVEGQVVDGRGITHTLTSAGTTSQNIDSHGNSITFSVSSGSITDSVNRTIPTPDSLDQTSSTTGCPSLASYGAAYQPTTGSALWLVPGANATTQPYLICYTTVNLHTNFWGNGGQPLYTYNVPGQCGDELQTACNFTQLFEEIQEPLANVIQSIVLPDHTYWGFIYDSADPSSSTAIAYGTMSEIITPLGGTLQYSYAMGAGCYFQDPTIQEIMTNGGVWNVLHLTQRTESDMLGHSYIWHYGGAGLQAYVGNVVTDPNGNDTTYTFANPNSIGCADGAETSRQVYQGSHTAGTLIQTTSETNQFGPVPIDSLFVIDNPFPGFANALVQAKTVTTDGVAPITTETTYDNVFAAGAPTCWEGTEGPYVCSNNTNVSLSLGLPVKQQEFDGQHNLLRSDETSYLWQSNSAYLSANLLNTPSSLTRTDNGGTQVSSTTISYDEPGLVTPGEGYYGEPTTQTKWNNTGPSVATQKAWTSLGMVDHEIDGLGNTSASYQYGSAYGGLYPTTVTNALGQATTYSYDLNTGQKTTVTDPNQNTTAYTYYNDGRLSKVNFPDMGSTQWVYSTDTMPPTQQSPATITGIAQTGAPEGAISSAAVFDGLGRLVERQLLTDPAGADIAEIAYDGLGHVVEESTPYRAGAGSPGISSYAYDALGRMVLHVLPDSSTEQWCYDGLVTASQLNIVTALSGNLRCPGLLSKNASGSWLDYFDEAGQHTQRVKDVLGRLTAVMEPGPATNIPSIETDYGYDSLDNLLTARQLGQAGETPRSRSFTYDSLARLLCASNPENSSAACPQVATAAATAATVSYAYDANSNLLAKTDARGVTTTYRYDALNRLTSKSAPTSNGIPGFQFGYIYDIAQVGTGGAFNSQNSIGRLVEQTNPTGFNSQQFSYDAMGRVVVEAHTLPSNCCSVASQVADEVSVSYDLAGNMTGITYPSGRFVHQDFNAAGQFEDSAMWGAQYKRYVNFVNYNPDGTPSVNNLGNNVFEYMQENNRLQPIFSSVNEQIPGIGSKIFLGHVFCYFLDCASSGANTGYVRGIIDALGGTGSRDYHFDSLNRVVFAGLSTVAPPRVYSPDSFGNMSPVSVAGYPPVFSPTFDSRNRITNLPCASAMPNGSAYDAAGNQLCSTDQYGGTTQYTYDSENRITAANALNAIPFETNIYGADGERVQKTLPGQGTSTEYINFAGVTLSELDQLGNWTDYIYEGGKKIAMVSPTDDRAHLSSTNQSAGNTQESFSLVIPPPAGQSSYTVQAGDLLGFRMYQNNASGTISVGSNSGLTDQNGTPLSGSIQSGQWVNRMVPLDSMANQTVGSIAVQNTNGPAGQFDVMVADMTITQANGNIIPIVGAQLGSSSGCTTSNPSNSGQPSCANEQVTGSDFTGQIQTTHYYFGDLLGSAQIELSDGGWPLTLSAFDPYGQEIDTQTSTNHYKFTGKERDTESGLDYFGARYYASNMGRWMSPDWSAKQEPVPYSKLDNPQSLNLYAYVYNNPLSKADPDGHDTCGSSNGGVCDATQHAPTDGHVHAWDVAGGTMAAGALYMSGRGLIAGASSLWGVGSRAAMSAYLGLSVLGTQGAQNLMSARDSVSSSLGAIRDAAASGEISLPGGTANLLKSAGNAVSNSFTNSDINGAIKQSVTGIEAGGDHVQELQGVANSLTNLSGRLSTALANPTLSDQTRTLYQNAVKAIQPAVDQINKLKQ